MSQLKISQEQFLAAAEIKRLISFQEQYRDMLKGLTATPGIIRFHKDYETQTLNFRVTPGTGGKIAISDFSTAVDKDMRVISYRNFDGEISIPAINTWYWVRIQHQYSPLEVGLVSVDDQGRMVGVGTKFTEILRGQPNMPSKVRFEDSVGNGQEYEVVRVIDDTNAILAGFFVPESNLRYAVVGTFTPGFIAESEDKDIFQYDSCLISFHAETSVNTAPAISSFNKGLQFYIARVRWNGSVVNVDDKRSDWWVLESEYNTNFIADEMFSTNAVIGVESIRFDHEFTTKDRNICKVGWGVRSDNWTLDNTNRVLTLNACEGGRIKTVADVANNQFNGWRLYNDEGQFFLISDTTQTGSQVNLNIPGINDKYFKSLNVYIVPNVEEIELQFSPQPGVDSYQQAFTTKLFPIQKGYGEIYLSCPNAENYSYNAKYRYKTGARYTAFTSFLSDEVGFYDETSFDEKGVIKANPIDRNRVPYESSASGGYITVIQDPGSYDNTIALIDKGDLRQVRVRALTNAVPITTLVVGEDEWVQIFDNIINLATDTVVNLSHTGIKNGNTFKIIFQGSITPGSQTLRITANYQNPGDPGKILYQFTPTDFNWCALPGRRLAIECWTNGIEWYAWIVEQDQARLGDILMRGNIPSGVFDGSGRGVVGEYWGWALCNGQNGTHDLRDRFIVGYDNRSSDPGNNIWDSVYNSIGGSGGHKDIVLNAGQLPGHTHGISEGGEHSHGVRYGTSGSGSGLKDATFDSINTGDNLVALGGKHDHGGVTGETGSNDPIDIRPSFYVLAFLQRI